MNKRGLYTIFSYIFLIFILTMSITVFAEESEETSYLDDQKNEIITEQEELLESLKKRLKKSVRELQDIQGVVSEFHFEIAEEEERIDSLEKQMDNLDRQIEATENKIINVTKQITVKELEIGELYEAIEIKQLQLEEQIEVFSAYLTFLYYKDTTFYDDRARGFNVFKLILDDDTISTNLSEITFLERFENQAIVIIDRLNELEEALTLQKDTLEINRRSLRLLRLAIQDEQTNLEALKLGKKRLLIQAQSKQKVYERLAAKEREAEEQLASEISALTLNIHAFDTSLEKIREAGNLDEVEQAIKIRDDLLSLQSREIPLNYGDDSRLLEWPLSPYRGITAYFADAGYASRFGVAHGAIDIRAPQGSPIFAPADGIVNKAYGRGNDDMDYHFVLLTHRNGIQTVFGHLSKIIVYEGQFVRKGDLLALTGGTPGTTGAGLRTTGPHLHFEVHQFGKKVDPLDYLSLTALPLKSIPQERIKQLYEQELAESLGTREEYEWRKKLEAQTDATDQYLDESGSITKDENDIPSAEEILETEAFDHLEKYERLKEQYEEARREGLN